MRNIWEGLKETFRHLYELRSASGSWSRCHDTSFIRLFRGNLDRVALSLSESMNRLVVVRYNAKLKCAELFHPFGDVIAQVNAEGEFSPSKVYVTSSLRASMEVEGIFRDLLLTPLSGKPVRANVVVAFGHPM